MHILSYVTIAQSLARVLYVILFDLKPLNEDSNWYMCIYCTDAQKGATEVSRTHM